ncbi:MAG: glycoside hydrolase family 13 protein [Firmicutes bacterium]|nr:glycoside hydrolase family 13 protein [Bacillota bacterium]
MTEVIVPQWAKDAVWYQIFPERFRNGDPGNDPRVENIEHHNGEPIKNWKIREWGSDWYAADQWETENFPSVFKSIYMRRYGGDLQGVADKLDYLKDLGINAIYLNPVFRAVSLHKYDGVSFHHIDETFGPDPDGDRRMIEEACETDDPATWVWTSADKLFLNLLEEAHKREIRVIIDGVFNHSGRGFFAFQDILKNGKESKYKDWYNITRWSKSKPDGFYYKGWFGFDYLPEFRKEGDNLNPGYKQYLFNITKRWMAPNDSVEKGIDGWRLDVAFCIPHGFWKEWRQVVKEINPEAYTTAEIIEIAPEYVKGDEFDAMMNYPFLFCVTEFMFDKKNQITATEFDKRLSELRNAYDNETGLVMQNLLSSHDTPRLRTFITNPDMNPRDWSTHHPKSQLEKNHKYRIDRGDEEHRQIHKLAVLFQMTYSGAPMIYYGDELGMTGANDPDCRKPMLWDDIVYEDEKVHPVKGMKRPVEKNQPDMDLFEHYKKMIKIRRDNPVLRRGTTESLVAEDTPGIFSFVREYEGEKVYVILNNGSTEYTLLFGIPMFGKESMTDILNNEEIKSVNGHFLIKIKPKWGVILR